MQNLYLKTGISKHDFPDGLEEQLSFLKQFQLSKIRKYFVWQVLTDRYFNRYDGLITKRNALLTFNDQNAYFFHATIDFYKQTGSILSFHRTLKSERRMLRSFEQKDLDRFSKTVNGSHVDRDYVDIGFLKNFDWLSQTFNQNPAYEKISPHDQCLISYLLSSALDVDFSHPRCNQEGILSFLKTNTEQKKLIKLLTAIKKKIKTMESVNVQKQETLFKIYCLKDIIFGKKTNFLDKKKMITLYSKAALIDPNFLASRWENPNSHPEFDYILIKAAHAYCNNENERENFIKNFENKKIPFFRFNIYHAILFRNKSPNIFSRIHLSLQARILKLPCKYSVPAQCIFWGAGICLYFFTIYAIVRLTKLLILDIAHRRNF